MTKFKSHDAVVLINPLSQWNLAKGHIGAIVVVYNENYVEVEFVDRSNFTKTLCMIKTSELRLYKPSRAK